MQEQYRRRPHSARNSAFDKAMMMTAACSLFFFASDAVAAVHEHADPYEVDGPTVATPSRHALPSLESVAARGNVPDGLVSIISSASELGLVGAQIPPHRATSLRLPPRVATSNATDLSLSVVDDYPALVGLSRDDLMPMAEKDGGKITYVHFRQQVDGLPVLQSHVVFQWDAAGHLRSTGADVYIAELGTSPQPQLANAWLPLADARLGALSGMPNDLDVTEWELEERAWFPLAEATAGPRDFDLRPVWNIRFRTENPPGWYDTIVDAETGSLLSRENRIRFEALGGEVTADVETLNPGSPTPRLPLRDVFLQVEGGGPFLTDAEGKFQTEAPAGEQSLTASLFGQRIFILDALSGHSNPTQLLDVTVPDENVEVYWNDTNSSASQRDAYYHGNVAYQEIRAINPGPELAALDAPMRTDVDDPSGQCNAFWDGTRMNFYAAGGPCISIARIADVVYHEYGHAVTQFTWWPANAPSDMHEGFSDYFAASILDNPSIGNGFFGPGSSLREIETDRVWPDDIDGDPHVTGLIIAGALWDVRAELGREVTDKLWHFAGLGASQNFHDYMLDMLIYDDDDADLTNGTPNFEVIVRNFRLHGIGDYSVSIQAALLPDIETPDETIDGTVSIWSLLPLQSDALAFFYSVGEDSEFTRVALTPIEGDSRGYTYSIPAPDDGTTVNYYWAAANEDGVSSTYPEGAPAETFSFFVGEDLVPPVVSSEREPQVLADQATSFYFRSVVSDNSQRIGRTWTEYRIGETGELREQDLTLRADGSLEVTIDLGDLSSADTFAYRVLAADESQTVNIGSWPAEGFHEIAVRPGLAHDFETQPGNASADNDWEWGEAPDGLSYSGTHAWGTRLDGRYADRTISTLTFGPIDLADYDRALLRFQHSFAIESAWDGGNIQIKRGTDPDDPNTRWSLLRPIGDYPYGSIVALREPGYSGLSGGWDAAVFPLDFYVGDTVFIRFRMGSDEGVNDLGWFLDDLQVLQAQAWVDPSDLEASDGENEQTTLRWRAPNGIDVNSGRLHGYNIYRRVAGSSEDEILLNGTPLNQFQYVDTGLDNAVAYAYRLTAQYDRGESDGVVVVATPFAATVRLSAESIGATLSNYGAVNEVLTVENAGAGTLAFDVFLADDGQNLEEVIAVHSFQSGDSDTVDVFVDANEISPVNVQSLKVFTWENGTTPMVGFQLQGAAPWGNPLTDWGGVLFIDTDGDLSTTSDLNLGWGEATNIGWDYGIIFGRLPQDAGLEGAALFFDAARSFQPVVLTEVDFPVDGDQLSLSLPASFLRADDLQLQLVVAPFLGGPPFDYVPNLPEAASWLTRAPKHGSSTPTAGTDIALDFESVHLQNGTHRASVLLRSNDRVQPVVSVPALLQVDRGLPAALASVDLSPSLAGMECSFSLLRAHTPTAVHVERALDTPEAEWERINASPLVPDANGVFHIVDRGVTIGANYKYQFPIEFEGGLSQTYGPVTQAFDPTVPDLASFLVESEIAGMQIEFQAPAGVAAVEARVERSLDTVPAEWSEITDTALLPDSSGVFRFLDLTVVEDTDYVYNFQVEVESGIVATYGPFAQTYVSAFPAELPVVVTSAEEALTVSATLGGEFNPLVGVWIDRRETGVEDWTRLSDVPMLPDENGVVSNEDQWKTPWRDGVESGVDYEYQFVVIVQGGRERAYGPYAAVFTPPLPNFTTILPSRPNPFQDQVVFRIDLAEASDVRLDLFDASGRRRRVLVDESMAAGAHQMVWDGQDDLSEDLPTGVYFARFKAGSVNKTMRVLRVR